MSGPGRHVPVDARRPVRVPAVGRKRLDAIRDGATRSSLESAASASALASAGFDLVSEVMGCSVVHFGLTRVDCGLRTWGRTDGGIYAEPSTQVSGRAGDSMPNGDAVNDAWATAQRRLFDEAQRVGADGVVGIRATRGPVPGAEDGEEFLLLGTAVRARGDIRPRRPFGTEQHGAGIVALLEAGLMPCGYAVTAAVGIRHDDWRTRQANTRWSGNGELPGFTELAQQTRQAARDQFGAALARMGAVEALASNIAARMWKVEADSHTDHLCEVTMTGTGLVSFRRGGVARPRSILPLTGVATRAVTTGPADLPQHPAPSRWTEATTALRAARVRRTLDRSRRRAGEGS